MILPLLLAVLAPAAEPTPQAPQPILVGFPTAKPKPDARATAAPAVTVEPAAAPTPIPAASAQPAEPSGALPAVVPESSAYPYRFIPHQPASPTSATPQIFAIYLNSKSLRSHGPIAIRVLTSANVVKVVTQSSGHNGSIPRVGNGDFETKSTLPALPFIASGITTTIDFVATTAAGKTVTVGVPVALQ